jgi:glycosyltransferase involved in cell wall biosynthesis
MRRKIVEQRLIVEQFDPEYPVPGGIDTCIRGLVKYCPPNIDLAIAGVDALGNKQIGEWSEQEIAGRKIRFMPVVRLDHTDLNRRVPHSVSVALGLRKYRPGDDGDVVQTHRINTGAVCLRLYPRIQHVQFIHSEGDLSTGSQSFFRHAVFTYRWLEHMVIPNSIDTVVFSKSGAERLQAISPRVRFSPTWYDPADFFPVESEAAEKTRIIWPYRIEPGKNPLLAIDIISMLSEKYTLTVAGAGTMEPAMKKRALQSAASKRVTFLGAVPKSEIGAVMRDHHLMLMTSSFEGFSRAIVEALACGLPVVTTEGGEPNGLVQTGLNGSRVEGYAPESFVRAVEIAAEIPASAAWHSVSALSAEAVVPIVLNKAPTCNSD